MITPKSNFWQLLTNTNAGFLSEKIDENHRIPFRTIKDRSDGTHKKTAGGQTIFSDAKENSLIKLIQVCGEWGYALSATDICMIAKRMLSKEGRQVRCFKNNPPGLG